MHFPCRSLVFLQSRLRPPPYYPTTKSFRADGGNSEDEARGSQFLGTLGAIATFSRRIRYTSHELTPPVELCEGAFRVVLGA